MNEHTTIPDHYYIGEIRVQPNIVLAPMAGVTDSVFRRLLLSLGGLGLVTTEMTNAASISPKALARHRLLEFLPEERPLAMQISGNEPELVASAARQVEALGADILDINCGCPSPKVTGGGHGSALLKDLPKLDRLLRAVRAAVSIPITLKFRAGWDEDGLNYEQTARIAEAAGVDAVALHPRTKAQGYSGSADWTRIAAAKRAVRIPVIGSGDVVTAQAALDRLKTSGVDGIMIGRGAMANPWIFRQVAELRQGIEPFQPTPADKQALLLRYLEMLVDFMPEHHATNKIKQLAGQFFVGLPGAASLRKNIQIAKTTHEQRDVILCYFAPFIDGTLAATVATEPSEEMIGTLVEA